ncbi:hypothetical protein AXF42_Ash019213 [Apostasia shenzhenica]|uniref:Uncharacterized protein n=1 Tax=Apostasia shenzhenica TaxID=1088818 RepID=A0A2I0B2I3_9ASPA|nr:hypothetical protein AXF42_Ash019213 [Apostasia shenzhenica]
MLSCVERMASKPYKNPVLILVFLVAFCSRVLPCSGKNTELHKQLEYLDTWQKADDAPLNMTPGPIGMLKFYPDGFFQVI